MKLIQLMNIRKYYQRCDFRESGTFVDEDEVFAWYGRFNSNLVTSVSNNRQHINTSEHLYRYLCLF